MRTLSCILDLATLRGLAILGAVLCSGCVPAIKVADTAKLQQIDGARAADFEVLDHRDQRVSLAEHTRGAIAVLVFYRGHW